MKALIILNREPYDGTDVTWNALRLAKQLLSDGCEIRIFLMNDSVDLARDICIPPTDYDQDLSQNLKDLSSQGASVKVCGTCQARCGIYKNEPYFAGAQKATMQDLSTWVMTSDKLLTF